MSYEYHEKIKKDLNYLEHIMGMQFSSNIYKREEKLKELDEVYAKAQAFDEYVKHNAEYGKTYYEITREHIAQEMGILLEKYESKD